LNAPEGGGPASQALPNSLRGAALVGAAVIVGIIGLQILDDSGGGSSVQASPTQTSTTATPSSAPHANRSQVAVKVYNASGVQNAGQAISDKLKGFGYNTLEAANYGSTRKGTVVQCKPGFEGDGVVIATYGIGNAATGPFPSSPPSGAGDADCIVILGTT
jgi:LytR cell envelope-related transcriptional attenuator